MRLLLISDEGVALAPEIVFITTGVGRKHAALALPYCGVCEYSNHPQRVDGAR